MFNTYQFSFILTVVAVFAMTNSTLAQTTAINNTFGEQVLINPKQQDILTIYADQREERLAQFSNKRYAFLFTPGSYNLDVRVGYNTQVLGLGELPDDVTIIGAVRTQDVPGSWDQGPGGLNNFWRGAENLSVQPTLGSITYPPGNKVIIPANQNVWAVSQAAPLRRIHIKQGNLRLFELGWTSGGFMANSQVDGFIVAGSQQQWYTRNSEWHGKDGKDGDEDKGWQGGAWNIVLANNNALKPFNKNDTPKDAWPNFPTTWIPQLPVSVDKPFLTYSNNEWAVLVPHAVTNPQPGVNWINNGVKKIQSDLYIAKPIGNGGDDSAPINDALKAGKSIILTPGEYNLNNSH